LLVFQFFSKKGKRESEGESEIVLEKKGKIEKEKEEIEREKEKVEREEVLVGKGDA